MAARAFISARRLWGWSEGSKEVIQPPLLAPRLTAVSVDPTGPDSRWGPRCRKDPDTRKEGPS